MDKILIGGAIYTMTGRTVSALAIQNGRIALAGSAEQVLPLKTEGTEVIDLAGRCVVPGFCDSHIHMLFTGVELARLDLRGVTSPEEIITRGRDYIKRQTITPGDWVIGYGFDHNLFVEPKLPDKTVAEAISAEHPVVLNRICGHVGAINRLAMEQVGYDQNTVIPGGGLDKAADGFLNGIIRETALDKVKTLLPRLTRQEVEVLLSDTGKRFASVGLTAVHSDDLGPEGTDWETLSTAMQALKERGELRVRIFEEWKVPKPEVLQPIIDQGYHSGWGDEFLQVCNIKLITDGSLGARTALLRQDYRDDPGNRGIPVYTQQELNELVGLCHEAGLQVACHAIGDGALEQCVVAVERAMVKEPKPLRHRIVHCQLGDRGLYERMGALGMGADVQPPFTVTDRPHVASRVGRGEQESYAWKTLLDCGVHVGGGSDSPVEDYSPLWGIYCAVTRSDGRGAAPWLAGQRLTVEEAVSIYTKGGAYLAGQEHNLGVLEAGKLADLVVLDRNLFEIPPEQIKEARVLLTMMSGQITHREEGI